MLELYFLLYRIPKMMTSLARERNRSPVKWTLIAIGAWIGAELFVGFAIGLIYGIGVILWGWPAQSQGVNILTYVLALVAALVSVTLVSRFLRNKPTDDELPVPPPPPQFRSPVAND